MKYLAGFLFIFLLAACEEQGGSQGSSSGVTFLSKGRYSAQSESMVIGYRKTENLGCAMKLNHPDYEDTIIYLNNNEVYLFQYDNEFIDVTPDDVSNLYSASSIDMEEVVRIDLIFNEASMSEGICVSYVGTPDLGIILDNQYFIDAVLDLAVNGRTDNLYNLIETE